LASWLTIPLLSQWYRKHSKSYQILKNEPHSTLTVLIQIRGSVMVEVEVEWHRREALGLRSDDTEEVMTVKLVLKNFSICSLEVVVHSPLVVGLEDQVVRLFRAVLFKISLIGIWTT
jgi:hypothetical protein